MPRGRGLVVSGVSGLANRECESQGHLEPCTDRIEGEAFKCFTESKTHFLGHSPNRLCW